LSNSIEEKWRKSRFYLSQEYFSLFESLCKAYGGEAGSREYGGIVKNASFEPARALVLESKSKKSIGEVVSQNSESKGVSATRFPELSEFIMMKITEKTRVCRDVFKVMLGIDLDPDGIAERWNEIIGEVVKKNPSLEKQLRSIYEASLEEVAREHDVPKEVAEREYAKVAKRRATLEICKYLLLSLLSKANVVTSSTQAVTSSSEAIGEIVEIAYGILKATGDTGHNFYRLPVSCNGVRESFEVVASELRTKHFLFPYTFESVEEGGSRWRLDHLVDPDALARGNTTMRFYRLTVSYDHPFNFASYLPSDDEFVRKFRLYARDNRPKLYSEIISKSPPVEKLKGEALRVFVENFEHELRGLLATRLPPRSGRLSDIIRFIPLGKSDQVSDLLTKYDRDYEKTLREVIEKSRRDFEKIGRILAVEIGHIVGRTEEELSSYFGQAGFIGFPVLTLSPDTLQAAYSHEVKVEAITDQHSPMDIRDPTSWQKVSFLRVTFIARSFSLDILVRVFHVFREFAKPPNIECILETVMERKGFFRFTPKCAHVMRKRDALKDFVKGDIKHADVNVSRSRAIP